MKTFKQFLGEEEYDHIKDRRLEKYGTGHDGSDRRGSSSYSPRPKQKGETAYQKEIRKKYGGKMPSALQIVKDRIEKESPGAIMKSDKK